jgi:hypothetical protein
LTIRSIILKAYFVWNIEGSVKQQEDNDHIPRLLFVVCWQNEARFGLERFLLVLLGFFHVSQCFLIFLVLDKVHVLNGLESFKVDLLVLIVVLSYDCGCTLGLRVGFPPEPHHSFKFFPLRKLVVL